MLEPGKDIRQLTGLRGIAAMAVVVHHASTQDGGAWYLQSHLMVDVFFVLSGFVMSHVYLRRETIDWKGFAVARFARIYPLHVATAVAMACAGVAYARLSGGPWPVHVNALQALREATLTMALPLIGADKLWNFPAWSISIEWWIYFTLFPLLAIRGRRMSIPLATIGLLAVAIALMALLYGDVGKPTRYMPALLRGIVGFTGGWLAFRVATETAVQIPAWAADALFAGTIAAMYLLPPVMGADAWFLGPFLPVMVFALATTDGGSVRFLGSRSLVWLGDVSFSIYLIHPIVLNVLEAVDARVVPVEGRFTWIAMTVPLTLAAAMVSHRWFEMPCRRLLRGGRRRVATQAPA